MFGCLLFYCIMIKDYKLLKLPLNADFSDKTNWDEWKPKRSTKQWIVKRIGNVNRIKIGLLKN